MAGMIGDGFKPYALAVMLALAAAPVSAAPTQEGREGGNSATDAAFNRAVASAKAAMMSNPDAALASAQRAARLGQSLPGREASNAVATGEWLAGEALTRLNRIDEAVPVIDAALGSVVRTAPGTKLHADLLRSRGSIAALQGQVQLALQSMHSAYAIYVRLGDARTQSIMLQNIGSIYQDARDFTRAISYLDQAAETFSEDPILKLSLHNNRGNALREMKQFRGAEVEFRAALTAAKAMNSALLEARIITNLAATQIDQGKLAEADRMIGRGLLTAADEGAEWRPFLWGLKARVAFLRRDHATAVQLLGRTFEGVDLGRSTMPFRDFHEIAWKVYAAAGRDSDALTHLAAFKRLNDDSREVAVSTNTALMGARFESANQELRIARLTAERSRRDLLLSRSQQRLHTVIVLTAAGGMIALATIAAFGVAYISIRRSRERVKAANADLRHAATHDPLTGLGNRACFRDQLGASLQAVQPDLAVMLVDLDRFKLVNDTFGHNAGDQLLCRIADRLRALMVDQPVTAYRLGGDEFAILVPNGLASIDQFAERIIGELSQPCQLDEAVAEVGATIGVALARQTSGGEDALVRSADLALYRAKAAGRGRFCLFETWMQKEADERRSLETDLQQALNEGQLSLAYQPIVDAADRRVVAYEALLRWDHPVRGEIAPTVFIPIAEEARLINEIGGWALREACAQATDWPDGIKVAVNLSVLQLETESLLSTVVHALASTGLDPNRLELEMTESVFLRQGSTPEIMLNRLRGIGISLALDDFGTGYSSLGYLQRAAFSTIKIDRSFVNSATSGSGESAAIIQAIVALARGLKMECTAEGIETERDMEIMRGLGCTRLQGYLFGRPLREERTAAAAHANAQVMQEAIASWPPRRKARS